MAFSRLFASAVLATLLLAAGSAAQCGSEMAGEACNAGVCCGAGCDCASAPGTARAECDAPTQTCADCINPVDTNTAVGQLLGLTSAAPTPCDQVTCCTDVDPSSICVDVEVVPTSGLLQAVTNGVGVKLCLTGAVATLLKNGVGIPQNLDIPLGQLAAQSA